MRPTLMKNLTLNWLFSDHHVRILIRGGLFFGCCVGRFSVMFFIRMGK